MASKKKTKSRSKRGTRDDSIPDALEQESIDPEKAALLQKAITFLIEKDLSEWEAYVLLTSRGEIPYPEDFIYTQFGLTWRDLGYSKKEMEQIIFQVWGDKNTRPIIQHLLEILTNYNEKFFDGVLKDEKRSILLISKSPLTYDGSGMYMAEEAQENMIGYRTIYLRVVDSDLTEESLRFYEDVLLHEMVHQMYYYVQLEAEDSEHFYGRTAKEWRDIDVAWLREHLEVLSPASLQFLLHSPIFTAIANHIGTQMGLPEVSPARKEDFLKAKTENNPHFSLEKWSGEWPGNLRPKNYYPEMAGQDTMSMFYAMEQALAKAFETED
jgi:hypothetical protein